MTAAPLTGFALQRTCLDIENLPPPAKAVLTALAIRADSETAQATPGIARLCRDTGLAERTVQRALVTLEEERHLTRITRPGHGVVYIVHPRQSDTPVRVTPPSERRGTPVTVTPKQPRTTKPLEKKRASQPKGRALVPIDPPADMPTGYTPDQWQGFVEMRHTIGKPLTASSAQALARTLCKLAVEGNPPGEVLDQSTAALWQGLFPLKGNHHGQRSGAAGRSPRASDHPGGRTGAAADRVFGRLE